MIEIADNFYNAEERDGWKVKTIVKQVWAKELEMYSEIQRICEKYNIKFFAEGGTLLGAIRHDGFIPWDDDMDIAMLREDYNKFCEVAPSEISMPFFFQNYKTDNVNSLFSRIRNSITTALPFKGIPASDNSNHGLFVDIFPLDKLPDNAEKQDEIFATLKELKANLKNSATKEERNEAITAIENYFTEINNLADCSDYTIYGLYRSDSLVRPASLYETEPTQHAFEMLNVPVMENYEKALECHYGNWHSYVIGGSLHHYKTLDPNTPYTVYKDEE